MAPTEVGGVYQIDTPGKLASITENNLSATFLQTADLDLTGCDNWPGIGNANNPFSGVYDGDIYTISNLSISATTDN